MKILLVIPRYNLTNKKDYRYFFPLGLGYISSVMKKAGYSVDCLNLNHADGEAEEVINNSLNSQKYDIVCTGSNALGYPITEIIINTAKNHLTKPKTILGGPIITSETDLIFNNLKPDFGVIGEAEETIVELLKSIEKKKNLQKVKGIIYFNEKGEAVKTQRREPPANLDALPIPDYEGFGFEEQLEHLYTNYEFFHNLMDYPRIYYMLCSRSCPFHCTFCYHEGRYRQRSIKNIMNELRIMVKKYKINIILPYDECLGLDKKRLYEFCEGIKKLRKEVPWELKWICQVRIDAVDKATLKMLKETGCEVMCYGFESFSAAVLKSMGKKITPEQIDKIFHETLEAKLAIQALFIFGDVAETKETAKETLDWWKNNAKGQVGLGCITPYPGSEIYNHCIRKGIIKDKLDFIKNKIAPGLGLWLNMTDKMTDEEIKQLRKEVLDSTSRYTKFVRPISVKKTEGKANAYSVKVKCPFCNEIIEYNNCYLPSRMNYGFNIICRKCGMRFFIVSLLQRIGYAHYPTARTLRDYYLNLKRFVNKKRL